MDQQGDAEGCCRRAVDERIVSASNIDADNTTAQWDRIRRQLENTDGGDSVTGESRGSGLLLSMTPTSSSQHQAAVDVLSSKR